MQGFWLVGVLLGWALAFRVGLGIQGLWIGIASGDSTAGALRTAEMQWYSLPPSQRMEILFSSSSTVLTE